MRKIALTLVLFFAASACGLAQTLNPSDQGIGAGSAFSTPTPEDSTDAAPVPIVPSQNLKNLTQIGNMTPAQAALAQQKLSQGTAAVPNASPTQTPEADTEFQELVSSSLGNNLNIFGQDLFENVPSTFAPLDRVQVTPDYIIEPDDELLIRAWGQIDVDFAGVVDRTGAIYVPKVGTINVAGVRYGDLHDYLQARIEHIFRNFQLSVSMGHLRSIQIYVVGQVRKPGSYTVSSLSSLLDALLASGGPSKRGSLRNIQLKRGSKVVSTFDLYDVIIRGDKSKDVTLMPGDLIYVPPVGPLVALSGSVGMPAIYELKDHTSLADLIAYAGGLNNTAASDHAMVERIDSHKVRRTEEVLLDPAGPGYELRDGDVVRILHISPKFDDTVTLRGNVTIPGHYPWHAGMRVHDLIPTRETLLTDDYWKKQNQLAINSEISGFLAVDDREQKHVNQAQLKNDVKRVSSEINWEYAVIQRFDSRNLTSHLLPFNLGKAIDGDESANLVLQPSDVVTIFSQSDIQVPQAQQSKFVHLEGEVKEAGVYEIQSGETLRHLILRIGGTTPQAYLFGSEFTRESTRVEQQARLDEYVSTLDQTVQHVTAAAGQSLNPQEAAMAETQAAVGRATVEKMRGVKATGRIVLEIKPDAVSLSAIPDLALEDGDRLLVPFRPATVNVIGSVYNTAAFIYKPGMTVADYLRLAGGARRDGDKGREFVIRADGSTVSKQQHRAMVSRNFNTLKLMPGDTIIVPAKVASGAALRTLMDYTTIIGQFGLAAAGFSAIFP